VNSDVQKQTIAVLTHHSEGLPFQRIGLGIR